MDVALMDELKQRSIDFVSLMLSPRQLCELELLLNGGFSPLDHYVGQLAYESILQDEHLPTGEFWPMPIVLDVSDEFAKTLEQGDQLALRDTEGFMHAVLTLEEKWQPNKLKEAQILFGSVDESHPGVNHLFNTMGAVYLSGSVVNIQWPEHYEFESLWHSPSELKKTFSRLGWRRVVAYVSPSPVHKMEQAQLVALSKEHQANILLSPLVGNEGIHEAKRYALIHAYKKVENTFPENLSRLSLLPLFVRYAGLREILCHALIQKNFGCSHIVVKVSDFMCQNESLLKRVEAQLPEYTESLSIQILALKSWGYDIDEQTFVSHNESKELLYFSHKQVKSALIHRNRIPDWFTYPSVLNELAKLYKPRSEQGFTLFFTGLSGSGKSTLAKVVFAKLAEESSRSVTLLDGDVVRLNLSSELGFSKKDRHINIKRIGFVASEIVKNLGIAVCAPIAPYAQTRREIRQLIGQYGAFIEIYVSTPLNVCESRDRKGLYAKARKGVIKDFTGISDPYDVPVDSELMINTENLSPSEAVQKILLYLFKEGYLERI